jgi:hypothetical protein
MVCPKCGGSAVKTNWVPPQGMDAYLREYKCLNFGHIFYLHSGKRAKVKKGG